MARPKCDTYRSFMHQSGNNIRVAKQKPTQHRDHLSRKPPEASGCMAIITNNEKSLITVSRPKFEMTLKHTTLSDSTAESEERDKSAGSVGGIIDQGTTCIMFIAMDSILNRGPQISISNELVFGILIEPGCLHALTWN